MSVSALSNFFDASPTVIVYLARVVSVERGIGIHRTNVNVRKERSRYNGRLEVIISVDSEE